MSAGSNIQPFNTLGFRLIDDIPPAPSVTSWNGMSGDVKGTLAEIFAFGTFDAPGLDNQWTMPYGTRRFQSVNEGNTGLSFVNDLFFEDPSNQGDPRVGTNFTTRAPSPLFGTTFNTESIYQLGFSGNVVDQTEWRDTGYITGSLDQDHLTGFNFWADRHVAANFFGNDPVSLPNPPDGRRQVAYQEDDLYIGANSAAGVVTPRVLSGWGQEFLYTRPQHAGITPGFVDVWSDADIFTVAGDGSGFWIMFGDRSHEDAGRLRGSYDAHLLTADPNAAWGLGLWTFDGSAPYQIAELDHLVGLQLFRGGLQLPNVDTTTAPVGAALAAKIVWDDTLQKVRISVDGGAYVDLSTFS